jgi:hypothetical protein
MINEKPKGHKVVFGIFDNRVALERGVEELKLRGFRQEDISVPSPNAEGSKDLAHEKTTKGPEVATAAAASGMALGRSVGGLVGKGIPEHEAKRYESILKKGGMMLSVQADDHEWVSKAEEILKGAGAHDISSSTEDKDNIKVERDDLRVSGF